MNPYDPPRAPLETNSPIAAAGQCPLCGARVSFWRVYFALGPQHVRCGSCRSLLAYDDLGGPALALLVGFVTLGGGLWFGWGERGWTWLPMLLFVLGVVVLATAGTGYVWLRRPLRARR